MHLRTRLHLRPARIRLREHQLHLLAVHLRTGLHLRILTYFLVVAAASAASLTEVGVRPITIF